MKYIYPKLSVKETPFFRIGGDGLGNILFTYARALVLAKKTDCKIIFPTWASLKLGPWLRREKDKRTYTNLFEPNDGSVTGLKKFVLLHLGKKNIVETVADVESNKDGSVLLYSKTQLNFYGLIEYRELIKQNVLTNLKKRNKKSFEDDFSKCINVHIRLGDFNKANETALINGKCNTSVPIEWYVNAICKIREVIGYKVKINIFSDGTDEQLGPVLELENVKRVFYGSSIADIVALSQAKLIITSGSSFSLWARFLGNCNSISYINQRREFVADKEKFEIETGNDVDISSIEDELKSMYPNI